MELSEEDALDLAMRFREVAIKVGDYLEENWMDLDQPTRQELQNEEFALLNASSQMRTRAVGIMLDEDTLSFDQLLGAARKAKTAIKKIKRVGQAIALASAVVGLAAAVLSKDPGAIAKNAKAVYDATAAAVA